MTLVKKFKPKKYVITFQKPVEFIDEFTISTNNIKKTKKLFGNWTCVHTRKWTTDDIDPI
jgi:hypothetical protein